MYLSQLGIRIFISRVFNDDVNKSSSSVFMYATCLQPALIFALLTNIC
jgi:hypothetical protein